MLTTLLDNDGEKSVVAIAALVWSYAVSDYARDVMIRSRDVGDIEALLLFFLWGLFLWWLAKRYAGGWTFYWSVFAVVSYAPFADVIDAAFGGILGLGQ